MTTPTDLHLRRIALGLDRAALSDVSGMTAGEIAKAENGKTEYVMAVHIAAIERLEKWDRPIAFNAIIEHAWEHQIDGRPVVWLFSDGAKQYCPWLDLCLGSVNLARAAAGDAYASLVEDGYSPIGAELLPAQFENFITQKGMPDTPNNRCMWWRHWSAVYKVKP